MFRTIRKKLIPLLGVSKSIMNESLNLKKRNEFEAFVIQEDEMGVFFKTLNKNLKEIRNARFQLAVLDSKKHWYMIDCYINNGELCTLAVDAATLKVQTIIKTLSTCVPTGNHFVFVRDIETPAIQITFMACPAFTREHISRISKINPDDLYNQLKKLIPEEDNKKNKNTNTWIFTTEHLPELSILAPLFRCMQNSIKNIKKYLPPSFFNETVSKSGNLNQWIEKHKVKLGKTNTMTGEEVKIQNHSILIKQERYLKKLNDNNIKFIGEYSGFGFITFPLLANIKKDHLKAMDINTLKRVTNSTIAGLNQFPQFTKKLSFLAVPAKHFHKTMAVKNNLQALKSETDANAYLCRFLDIIYDYAGYLEQHNSDRTLKCLIETFEIIKKELDNVKLKETNNNLDSN